MEDSWELVAVPTEIQLAASKMSSPTEQETDDTAHKVIEVSGEIGWLEYATLIRIYMLGDLYA